MRGMSPPYETKGYGMIILVFVLGFLEPGGRQIVQPGVQTFLVIDGPIK